jgi:hypothetical protein
MDIGNYMIAFLDDGTIGNNTILSPESVNEMLTLQIPSTNSETGLNWYKTILYPNGEETLVWGHNGGEQGVSTYLFIDPENDIGIALLTNGEGDGLYICDELYAHALDMNTDNSIISNCAVTADLNKSDNQKNDIFVYPNPTKDVINLKMEAKETTWFNILSISGQLILSGHISGANPQIKVAEIPVGLYILQVENKSPQLIEIN